MLSVDFLCDISTFGWLFIYFTWYVPWVHFRSSQEHILGAWYVPSSAFCNLCSKYLRHFSGVYSRNIPVGFLATVLPWSVDEKNPLRFFFTFVKKTVKDMGDKYTKAEMF